MFPLTTHQPICYTLVSDTDTATSLNKLFFLKDEVDVDV